MDRTVQVLLLMICYAIPIIGGIIYRIKKNLKKQTK